MNPLPFQHHDPQENGPQYLEDLATGYWYSEALFTGVELGIFTLLEPEGKNLEEVAGDLRLERGAVRRFLQTLCALGLLGKDGETYFNTKLAKEYLVKGSENYQGDSILWRKALFPNWRSLGRCLKKGGRVRFGREDEGQEQIVRRIRRYGRAMDCVAKSKVKEILPFLADLALAGEILDVGSGPGAISAGLLKAFPKARATLMDIPEMLDYARELLEETASAGRLAYCPANILEPWPVKEGRFALVILSNIVHAYAEAEVGRILERAAACLSPEGILLVHDFFFEYRPEKASLFDLNMLVNTFNGKVYGAQWVREQLAEQGLSVSELLPLGSDTALLFAAKDAKSLHALHLDRTAQLAARIKRHGFRTVCPISVNRIHVPGWGDLRCRYGCDHYGKPHCPPGGFPAQKTREMLQDYTACLLLEGAPPTRDFQRRVLRAEKEAFTAGYYKAFALWAGPCTLCDVCSGEKGCRNSKHARPSMEAAGIDVFATVKETGLSLRTLADRDDYVKYFAILLLE